MISIICLIFFLTNYNTYFRYNKILLRCKLGSPSINNYLSTSQEYYYDSNDIGKTIIEILQEKLQALVYLSLDTN